MKKKKSATAPKKRKRHHSVKKTHKRRKRSMSGLGGLGFAGVGNVGKEMSNIFGNVFIKFLSSLLFGKVDPANPNNIIGGFIPGISQSDPLKKYAVLWIALKLIGSKLKFIPEGAYEVVRTKLSDAILLNVGQKMNVDFLLSGDDDMKGNIGADIMVDPATGQKFINMNTPQGVIAVPVSGIDDSAAVGENIGYDEQVGNDYGGNDYGDDYGDDYAGEYI